MHSPWFDHNFCALGEHARRVGAGLFAIVVLPKTGSYLVPSLWQRGLRRQLVESIGRAGLQHNREYV